MDQLSPVEKWLTSIKMDQYIELFHINGIRELHKLQHLDDDTLAHMGVSMRGHQKRILMHRPLQQQTNEYVLDKEIDDEKYFLIAPGSFMNHRDPPDGAQSPDDMSNDTPSPPIIPSRVIPELPPRPHSHNNTTNQVAPAGMLIDRQPPQLPERPAPERAVLQMSLAERPVPEIPGLDRPVSSIRLNDRPVPNKPGTERPVSHILGMERPVPKPRMQRQLINGNQKQQQPPKFRPTPAKRQTMFEVPPSIPVRVADGLQDMPFRAPPVLPLAQPSNSVPLSIRPVPAPPPHRRQSVKRLENEAPDDMRNAPPLPPRPPEHSKNINSNVSLTRDVLASEQVGGLYNPPSERTDFVMLSKGVKYPNPFESQDQDVLMIFDQLPPQENGLQEPALPNYIDTPVFPAAFDRELIAANSHSSKSQIDFEIDETEIMSYINHKDNNTSLIDAMIFPEVGMSHFGEGEEIVELVPSNGFMSSQENDLHPNIFDESLTQIAHGDTEFPYEALSWASTGTSEDVDRTSYINISDCITGEAQPSPQPVMSNVPPVAAPRIKSNQPDFGVQEGLYNELDEMMSSSSLKQSSAEDVYEELTCHSESDDDHISLPPGTRLTESMEVKRLNTLKRMKENVSGVVAIKEKSGYLSKQGGQQGNRGLNKRWVVFNGRDLRYYENEKKVQFSKKVIPVGAMRDVKILIATGVLKNNSLELETTNRVYIFSHDSVDEISSWGLTLMNAILKYEPPVGGYPIGGDMSSPDKEGFMKVDETRMYVAVKGDKLSYYKSQHDFDAATPISDVEMKLASCKILPKNKIQMSTPTRIFILTLDSYEELNEWHLVMKEAIAEGLADHTVLKLIQQNIANKFCADCGMPDPDWAATNLGVIICKTCSGSHRKLGVQISKVRSIKMDTKIWSHSLQQIMISVGNKINAFWEDRVDNHRKPKPDDSIEMREEFIERKYKYRMYCKSNPIIESKGQEGLDKELCRVASCHDGLYDAMVMVYSGASITKTNASIGMSAMEIANHANLHCIMEIFSLNKDIDFSTRLPPPRSNNVHHRALIPPTVKDNTDQVQKAGYLHKTGLGKKEFQRRYCRLENGILSYFLDDKSPIAKNNIEAADIIMLGDNVSRPGFEHCFEVGVNSGRIYLFCSESVEDKQEWLFILAKLLTPKVMWTYLDSYNVAGYLHKKEGSTSNDWRRLFFLLRGKTLSYFSAEKDKMDDLDLRKLKTSHVVDKDEKSTSTEQTICVCFPRKTLFLRSENKENCERWYKAIQKASEETGTLIEDQQLTEENIPVVVSECIRFVEMQGLKTEGIYRHAGTKSKVTRILQDFNPNARNVRLTLEEDYLIHDVASALKQYFRELDDPLLTSALHQEWIQTSVQSHSRKVIEYSHLVKSLPEINRSTLKTLIDHLNRIAHHKDENLMELKNLAAVFGPTLMAGKNAGGGFGAANYEISVIGDLMANFSQLFEVTAKEREKQKKLDDLINSISEHTPSISEKSNDDVHVTVFIGPKSENEFVVVKIGTSMTAAEIISYVIEINKINMLPSQVALFEVLCDGELERVFHPQEKILREILNWNDKWRSTNYICVKANDMEFKIEKYLALGNTSSTVKFSDGKKGFKKGYFEAAGTDLRYYKDSRNPNPINSWKISDVNIYFGVEKKRSAKFGFTFIDQNEPLLLRTVCLETEEEMYMWLGCLLNAKRQWSSSSNNNLRPITAPHSKSRSVSTNVAIVRYKKYLRINCDGSKSDGWRRDIKLQ